MKRKILCTGFSVPPHLKEEEVTHLPLIEEIALPVENISLENFTHLIFTSKTALRLFCEENENINKDIPIISVGQATTHELKKIGFCNIHTAEKENAEGVVELIHNLPLTKAHFLWPRSNLAREVIEDYFKESPCSLTPLDLYTVRTRTIPKLPDWTSFDFIYFSSPSTINAFVELYKTLPPLSQCLTIGEVSENHLKYQLNFI